MEIDFKSTVLSVDNTFARRIELKILQVNVGNRCNQQCAHCHVNAGPAGTNVMSKAIMDDIVSFLSKKKGLALDITGGCPELNPNLKYLIENAKPYAKQIIVRTNLTILLEPDTNNFIEFYKKNEIHLISSMPCYTEENVDKQRGSGVFQGSIKALKILNKAGYGKGGALILDLVYNPGGAFLPGEQSALEGDYKKILKEKYGIVFNSLLTITNAPINRFEKYLKANGEFNRYLKLLTDNFNRDTAGNIMCRSLLSVGWDGRVYDCDFNQALGLNLKDSKGEPAHIGALNPDGFAGKEIIFEKHCYCCTAGAGSSCAGALK